jgi:multiple antibiotic resistance protein
MLEIALVALTTFFATIGPVDVAAIFAGITHRNTPLERRRMAIRGWAIAGISATREETDEAATKADISVFPLATPLLAGPGAMGAAILLMAESNGDTLLQAAVIGALLVIMLLSLALLLLAGQVSRLLGVTGLNVISRVVGVLLAALAVQFLFDGIAASGLIPGL